MQSTSIEKNNQCASVRSMAERELASFRNAVKRMFGPEEASRSADDWLRELQASPHTPLSLREWRRITINASARLAARLAIPAHAVS